MSNSHIPLEEMLEDLRITNWKDCIGNILIQQIGILIQVNIQNQNSKK